MLVLSRRRYEKVIIHIAGQRVEVSVVGQTHGGQFKLGFDADPEVHIDREEIYDRIQKGDCK